MVQWFADGRKNYKGPVVELVGGGDEDGVGVVGGGGGGGAVYAADGEVNDKEG